MSSWPGTMRVIRATMTNQLARVAPQAYVRLTGQTGRGSAAEEGAADIASYFESCTDDYFKQLDMAESQVEAYLKGKTLLEYGPGDFPGVAMLMVGRGGEKVYCADRFPLVSLSEKNGQALAMLIDGSRGRVRDRLVSCLANPDDPMAGFNRERIEYLVRPSGLSGMVNRADLVFSRAVLEHVNDLDATFADMTRAMRPGAKAIHLVDLRSHGLHQSNPLDFLALSDTLWHLMYSEKGVPNRWRVDKYRRVLEGLGIDVQRLEASKLASESDVAAVRPLLDKAFAEVSDEDLRWLGFWLVFQCREASA